MGEMEARDEQAPAPTPDEVVARQADVYSAAGLHMYDTFVLGYSNTSVWRCPSSEMLERYDRSVGARHLDVGVATGWYLDRCCWPVESPAITLLDLSEESLATAADRIRRYEPRTIRANVLEPFSLGDARFDSIACNFLFHCVPGAIDSKARAIVANLEPYLEPDGVLFGSTILGRGVSHSEQGRELMRFYNEHGMFANLQDDRDGLHQGLRAVLADVDIQVVGAVALFTARRGEQAS